MESVHTGAATRLLTSQTPLLESMLHCMGQSWPCILVGPPASGVLTLAARAMTAERHMHCFTMVGGLSIAANSCSAYDHKAC